MKELMTTPVAAEPPLTKIIIAHPDPAFQHDMRQIIQQLHPEAEVIITAPDTISTGDIPKVLRSGAFTPSSDDDPLRRLSDRQRDVLDLVVSGETNKSIARKLGISPSTVSVHVSAMLRTLGVTSRTAAAAIAAKAPMADAYGRI